MELWCNLVIGLMMLFIIELDIFLSEKNGIAECINHNFARTRINWYNSLPKEKIFTFHNVIKLIKSVINKNENNNNYNIFLEKGSYKDKSRAQIFLKERL